MKNYGGNVTWREGRGREGRGRQDGSLHPVKLQLLLELEELLEQELLCRERKQDISQPGEVVFTLKSHFHLEKFFSNIYYELIIKIGTCCTPGKSKIQANLKY